MSNRDDDMVTLSFERVETDTAAAWLVVFEEEEGVQAWMPKSRCELDLEAGKIRAPQWLVEEKEIEDYAD